MYRFFGGVASETHTEFLEDFMVYLAEHNRGMHLAAHEQGELLECPPAVVVVRTEHRQRNQHLIGVKAWIV